MLSYFVALIATVVFFLVIDSFPRGRAPSLASLGPRCLIPLTVFGGSLVVTGQPRSAAILSCALATLLIAVSTLKQRTLGEPLVFSDLVVVSSFIRYPRFYLDAISIPARIAIIGLITISGYFLFSSMALAPEGRAIGILLGLTGNTLFRRVILHGGKHSLMQRPALIDDVRQFGLFSTLWAYALRWKMEENPPKETPIEPHNTIEIDFVCIIQCESFMDPTDLEDVQAIPEMPEFSRLMNTATRSGKYLVNHFGAYTMRSEYGVLFGRDEEALGFRKYDPYLTAKEELSFSLANRLKNIFTNRIFLHPHDLRFYGRDRLMPAAGFNKILGPEVFGPKDLCGRYVGDEALAHKIVSLMNENSADPTLLYAVSMENHGPWSAEGTDTNSPCASYCRHLESADHMLGILDKALKSSTKKSVLIFYGDHRPSIPDISKPDGSKETVYFIHKYGFSDGNIMKKQDLSPAELHKNIIDVICNS